ncbi:tetratricopeptide repeat protein [Bradyrhizobium prioriisuperbiae]|uniref:O-linked N-acetylglucosamine transferase, SPINDLY family protein n=1 Tax=Bradyrhizobium prioriisuperbiae TaxID=2854389 RepID=UPI0028E3E39D|nr:tetratricopeptide repeat protein [Bradyrhizobium prioritasuperba]
MATTAELFQRAMSSFQQGRLEEAERQFKQLLRKETRHPAALNILAAILMSQKKYGEAEPYLQTALKVNATSDATFYNYGLVLKALGRPDEALARFSQAIGLNPGNADSWNNRGTVLNDLKDPVRAIDDFEKALSINPRYAAAYFNKARSLADLKKYDEALAAHDQALALNPNLAEAWFGRGFVFHQLQRHEEAARAYEKALQIDPKLPFLKGSLVHEKMLTCDWDGIAPLIADIERDIAAGKLATEPFSWQGLATSQQSLQQCAKLFSDTRFPPNVRTAPRPSPAANGKIRIGYLSGEFRQQATSLLLVGVLEQHDKDLFEITAIDNGWDDGSETRQRIDAAVHRVLPIRGLADPDAVTAIRDQQIDILVNLNGYFGEERTRVFARRAAPIQVNYLGFPGTLGASYMDYIIADRHVLPETDKPFYAERVAYLPNCYQANDRSSKIAPPVSRADCGLPTQGVVFCCFNNVYKITPDIFERWMQILAQVEGSVLWLLADDPAAAANLRREAVARGVDGGRLIFAERRLPAEHLARHRCADLFLDTLPYNAHTTASDALWAGLPLLTCSGTTFAGRVAASLLRNIELPELVTETLDDYVLSAVTLANHPDRLAAIRQKLDDHRLNTPLFDTARFTRHLEAAFAAMVERHRAGLAPAHIVVPD